MLNDFLACIGGLTCLVIIGFIFVVAVSAIQLLIEKLRRNYQIRHRFDKPPTAKCYCIDCKHHNNETGRCWRFGETTKEYRCTADNWFCWEAEPRKENAK